MPPGPPAPYPVRPAVDLPLLGLALAALLATLVEVPPPACLPHCAVPPNLNPLDRLAVGGYSAPALLAANLLLTALLLAPVALEAARAGLRRAWRGAFVYALALAVAQAAIQLAKFAIDRHAPFVYTPDLVPLSALHGLDAARAFPSGHTASAFAGATLFAHALALRLPRPRRAALTALTLLALLAAAAVGLLKIAAGYHYPTDVAAGALVGTSVTALVLAAHRPIAPAPPTPG